MRQSVTTPVLFATALFFQCYALAAAATMPLDKGDGGGGISSLEQDALSSLLLAEEALAGDRSVATARGDPRGLAAPVARGDRNSGPRVIMMLADAALLRSLRALDRGPSFYRQPYSANGLPLEHREPGLTLGAEPGMALLKRDTMRCMVGRVYRPCWEV
ncbi:hypothetical protein NHX12_027060 [Muraenolepis orangiensis]|uniref:Melanin-concentrating hormone n=1 Tax=Muraenolepis orangiensis TaxID=630683 RepID=A0A9Q0EE91_9TELE|nr:hypothetical protein NHX12_027060 [Muraenolepis orangiensis]